MRNIYRANICRAACALAILSALPAPAGAATFVFEPGSGSVLPTETVMFDFNDPARDTLVTGTRFRFLTGTSGDGALPAAGDRSRYLSVLAGGEARIAFDAPVFGFSVDLGSLDSYNLLTLNFVGGGVQSFTGGQLVALPDGNQSAARTNGRFRFTADQGQQIAGVTFGSGGNSFEIDRLAAAPVPEPAMWAMMLGGFGLLGVIMRRRSRARQHRLA